MRTGTQLFILTITALAGCFFADIFADSSVYFFVTSFMILGTLFVANIVREHYYVMREARLQKFEIESYWAIVKEHPEVLSDRVKVRGMGFES